LGSQHLFLLFAAAALAFCRKNSLYVKEKKRKQIEERTEGSIA